LVELLDEVVDRALVLGQRFRHTALVEVADGLFRDPNTLSLRHVGEPFVLAAPQLGRDQDRELREPRRHRGLVAAKAAELLRELAEFRRMQKDREWPADGGAAPARTRADRVEEGTLNRRELVFREHLDARWWHLFDRLLGGLPGRWSGGLFGGHLFPHGDVWGN